MTDRSDEDSYAMARARERHWTMLVVATAVLILSVVLHVRDDQRVVLQLLPDYPIPESCVSKVWFNCECPGCGLTRSFIYLAHGDWSQSLKTHRVGWLLAFAVLAQFPYRLFLLSSPDHNSSPHWSRWFGWLLIASLIGNWLLNVLFGQRH